MNIIQKEQESSKKYFITTLSTKEGIEIAELTHSNVALVESMIRYDSDYSNSSNTESETSSAYWLLKLKKEVFGNNKSKSDYRNIIENCVQYIDSENSTHLNADGVGRKQMTERLVKLDKAKLVEYLRHPEKENYKLIEILTEKTVPEDSKYYGRKNFSFATKFCHYACFYLFEGYPEQDNYSIYDNVVRKVLPRYCVYYKVSKPRCIGHDYSTYQATIDAIIEASGVRISRNGFDHLLWYCFKGRN